MNSNGGSAEQSLESLMQQLTAWLGGLLQAAFGLGVHRPIYQNLTWAHVISSLLLLALVVVVHALAASLIRRRHKHLARQTEPADWRIGLLRAIGRPLYCLIWVFGVYLAFSPVVIGLAPGTGRNQARWVQDRLVDIGIFICILWVFFRLTRVIEARLQVLAARSKSKLDDLLVPLIGKSARVIGPVIAIIMGLPVMQLPPGYTNIVSKFSSLLIVGTVAWILFNGVSAGEALVVREYDVKSADNLQARRVYTQIHVLSRTLYVLIVVFSIASALMLFEEVRRFGTSILASAGVAGIIAGLAAQRTLANLFAGFQLAMTQPIRIDDVVIIEKEWGRIEEITLSYVVVHIWDDRRLIVPLSEFIEKPFQNWTRASAQLLASIFVWTDYSLPVADVRRELQQIVESCKDWDHRFWNVQVSDANEHAMQLRVLATAADSSKSWDLQCDIREKLIRFIQEKYPQSLPRVRAELDGLEHQSRSERPPRIFEQPARPQQNPILSPRGDGERATT